MLARKKEYMLTNHLEDVYEDTYYKTAYFESNITGTEKIINKLDKSTINAAIKKVWVADGKNFSDRIWHNTTKLAQDLTKDLTIAIITGKSNLAKDLTKRYNVSIAQANRLVQTETSAIRNQATMKRYEDSGIDKYQVIATLDTHTSDICKTMDKKIFETKDKQIGINYPPFHINCRSTTIAYFPELEEEKEKEKVKEKESLENESKIKDKIINLHLKKSSYKDIIELGDEVRIHYKIEEHIGNPEKLKEIFSNLIEMGGKI